MKKNITQHLVFVFVFLLLLILIEGALCQPQIDIVIKRQVSNILPFKFCNNFFFNKFWEENGFLKIYNLFYC
jgi:hypothetical protein